MSELHTITDGTLSVTLTTAGGSMTSIAAHGREYLWQGDPEVWSGQAPICFPICGGLRDGRAVTADGRAIELGRHGFARKRAWTFVEKGERTAALKLASDAETLAGYPFAFELVARYELRDGVLHISYEVTNPASAEGDLPFFIGGHPAFDCPLVAGESYGDYLVRFEHPETATVPRAVVETGLIDVADRTPGPQDGDVLPLTHELFAVSETIYDELTSREATLTNRAGTAGVRLRFPDMPYLVVWGKPAGDFVAIEPWGGLSTCSDEDDVFEHKRGLLVAHPGETVTRGFSIEVF